jgi:hypothetical protein
MKNMFGVALASLVSITAALLWLRRRQLVRPGQPGDPQLYDHLIDTCETTFRELRARLRELNPPTLRAHHQQLTDELLAIHAQTEHLIQRLRRITRVKW